MPNFMLFTQTNQLINFLIISVQSNNGRPQFVVIIFKSHQEVYATCIKSVRLNHIDTIVFSQHFKLFPRSLLLYVEHGTVLIILLQLFPFSHRIENSQKFNLKKGMQSPGKFQQSLLKRQRQRSVLLLVLFLITGFVIKLKHDDII